MTGIQEVELSLDFKLRNIEETEAAKKQLLASAGAGPGRCAGRACDVVLGGCTSSLCMPSSGSAACPFTCPSPRSASTRKTTAVEEMILPWRLDRCEQLTHRSTSQVWRDMHAAGSSWRKRRRKRRRGGAPRACTAPCSRATSGARTPRTWTGACRPCSRAPPHPVVAHVALMVPVYAWGQTVDCCVGRPAGRLPP
jgi:hypothetical protein